MINSAGIARHSSCLESTAEDFDEVMKVNVKGAYFLSQPSRKVSSMLGSRGC